MDHGGTSTFFSYLAFNDWGVPAHFSYIWLLMVGGVPAHFSYIWLLMIRGGVPAQLTNIWYQHIFPHTGIGFIGNCSNGIFNGTTRLAKAFIWLCKSYKCMVVAHGFLVMVPWFGALRVEVTFAQCLSKCHITIDTLCLYCTKGTL